ncbi:hypothetical protein SprV_0100472200 [Sparganum proliferum]
MLPTNIPRPDSRHRTQCNNNSTTPPAAFANVPSSPQHQLPTRPRQHPPPLPSTITLLVPRRISRRRRPPPPISFPSKTPTTTIVTSSTLTASEDTPDIPSTTTDPTTSNSSSSSTCLSSLPWHIHLAWSVTCESMAQRPAHRCQEPRHTHAASGSTDHTAHAHSPISRTYPEAVGASLPQPTQQLPNATADARHASV